MTVSFMLNPYLLITMLRVELKLHKRYVMQCKCKTISKGFLVWWLRRRFQYDRPRTTRRLLLATSSLTYRQRSVLCAGWVAALLPVGLRASIEGQVMLTGLAGIVLSVWHSVFCGNPILWRWWKWDGSKRLNHCVRSCCWLLVTLEQIEKEKSRRKIDFKFSSYNYF